MQDTAQTLTLQVSPSPLPATARLTITTGGTEGEGGAGNINAPATATIPTGMMSATFDITLAADATTSNTGTVSLSDAVFIHADSTTDTIVIGGELFVLNIDSAANVFTLIVGDPSPFTNICGRTPEVRDTILALITETECGIIPITELRTITELDLQERTGRDISNLKAGDFANLSNLVALDLRFNNSLSLSANVFDGLFRLQSLNLGQTDLESLPSANVFEDLSNLTRLNLGTNELESLPVGLFDGLSLLNELFLDNNDLTSISVPANVFDDLSNLTVLTLNGNDLESLSARLFDGLSALQILRLHNNRLTPPLPPGLFNDVLGTLTELTLNGQANNVDLRSTVSIEPRTATIAPTGMQTLTAQLTTPSPATVRLTITKGGDEEDNVTLPDPATVTIPAGMMSADFDINLTGAITGNTGTVSLSTPVLLYTDTNGAVQENSVDAVVNSLVSPLDAESGTFTFTVFVQPLGTVNICNRTDEVRDAILANNAVTSGTNCATVLISDLNAIVLLVLSNMGITTLRVGDFANLPNLQNLALGFNNLESPLEGVFDNLDNLLFLTLNNNNLGPSLPAGLFNDLRNLQALDMGDNNLESLPAGLFDGLFRLRELYLDRNNLTPPLPTGLFDDALNRLDSLGLSGQENNADLRSTVSIEPSTVMIAPNATQTLTVRLTPPSPAIVRLTILAGGVEAEAGNVTLPDPATVTIPAGMTTATFDITLGAGASRTGTIVIGLASLVYTDTVNMEQENTFTGVTTSLVNVPSTPSSPTSTFTVAAPDVNICGRTDEVRDAILAYVSEANCAAVPQTSLDTVDNSRALFINNNMSLTTLRVGDFDNLPNLTALDLSDNRLRSLHEDVFRDLSSLTILILSINNLGPSLPLRLFDGLSSLEVLNLDINSLTPPLPVGLFNDVLDSLIQLSLDDEVKPTVSIIEADLTIAPGIPQTYTAQLIPASPADVRLNIIVNGPIEHVMLPSTTVTIPAGMMTATFDIGLTAEASEGSTRSVGIRPHALLYTDTSNDVQENTAVIGNLVNMASTARRTFTVGAPAVLPTVEFTRNNGITSVDEPEGEDTLTIRFDYAISDIPVSSSFTSLAVNFGTLGPGPGYVPTFSGNLPHAATLSDPSSFDNGAVTFNDNPAFTRYNFDTGFSFPATFSRNIQYQISADNNTTDDDFNLGITSVVLSGGSGGDITIPGAAISVPGGRHVTAGGTTYAVQTITIIDAQTPLPAGVRYDLTDPYAFEPAADGTNAGTGTFTITLSNLDTNSSLENSNQHRFTFRLESDDDGNTPGYGNVDRGTDPADTDDFELYVEYVDLNSTAQMLKLSTTSSGYELAPFDRAERISINGEQTYTFHVVPTRNDDNDLTPGEDVVFGFHVLFSDSNNQFATAVVNNSGTALAMGIFEAPDLTFTRSPSPAMEGSSPGRGFDLSFGGAPGVATVTYTLEVTGQNPSISDINVSLSADIIDRDLVTDGTISAFTVRIDSQFRTNVSIGFFAQEDDDHTDELVTLTISRIEIADIILGPDDLICGDCAPPGTLSIAIEDNEPTVTLTRDRASVTELTPGSATTFTLALRNAPNGESTIRSTITIAGDNASEDDFVASVSGSGLGEDHAITVSYTGDQTSRTGALEQAGGSGFFTIDITGSTADFILSITPNNDRDLTNEIFTYAVTSVEFAGFTPLDPSNIMCTECAPAGALSITIIDVPPPSSTPAAAYDSPADIAITEGGGLSEVSAERTLTLTNAPDNNAATVSFELAGGTANVAGLNQADIDFSVSGGVSPVIDLDGMGGMFTIPADTPETTLTFTARTDNDSTGEQLTFTITGIVFADASTVAGNDLPGPLTINITDPTPSRMAVSVSDSPISVGETTIITFALSNIPERVDGNDVVARTEFVFRGFPLPDTFTIPGNNISVDNNPPGGALTFEGESYDLTISGNISRWRIRHFQGQSFADLYVDVPPSALTDEAVDVTLAVTAKTASTLTLNYLFMRSYDASTLELRDTDSSNVTGIPLTLVIVDAPPPSSNPAAVYDSPADIAITEGGGPAASTERVLTLTDAPNSIATVSFELAGGTAYVTNLTEADIDFSVSGGGSLNINNNGTGGTFTILAGTPETTLTFTARDSTDSTGERITFTITGITFADVGGDTDIPALPPLTINITDPTRSVMTVTVSNPTIAVGEMTIVTFALSNFPVLVDGIDVVRTEFSFRGFPPQGEFNPPSNSTGATTTTSRDYDLAFSGDFTNWGVRGASGDLVLNVPVSALIDDAAANIVMTVTAKAASMLTATHSRTRSFGAGNSLLRTHEYDQAPSLQFTITEAFVPPAAHIPADDIAIIEGGDTIVRTLTLTNAPDNNAATVSFELGGGTAHVAGLDQADIDFGVSSDGSPDIDPDGMGGTFTIPAGTPAANLSFTARADDDSTGEQLTFAITGIVFADASTVAGNDLPGSLTINVTDITPGRIEVSVSSTAINRRETADITFALRNIPEKVSGVDVAGVEFVFRGFPPPGDFDRSSGDRRATFMSAAYDLTISNIVGLTWSIADATAPGTGELIVNVPASALTDEAADIILTVTPNTTAMLTATFDRARVYDASDTDLEHTINATGSPFTVTILLEPAASYDASNVVLIEGLIPSEIRTLTLIDVPNADAIAEFTLADGVANGASVTTPDITIAVGGGADMLSLNAGGDGGTFRIPAGDLSTTIAFTIPTPADADTDAEVIAFTITEIDFTNTESGIGLLSTLVIVVGESPCHRTPAVLTAISNAIGIDPNNCRDGDITAAQLSAITGTFRIRLPRPGSTSLRSDDFAGLTSLNALQLNSNSNALTELPAGVFAGLTSLNQLQMFSNALATLPANVFSGLTGLTELHLGSNDLERLEPGLFNDLTNLRTLRLNANNFTALDPGLFGILTSLTILSLNRNSLATLPENIFAGLTNLIDLNLSQQNLGDQQTLSLPANLFQGLNNLTLLQLHNNPRLISLDADLFDGMIGPLTLNLSNNPELTSLDADLFDGLSRMGRLDLNNNPGLTSLDTGLFNGLSGLRTLNLNDNPGLTSLNVGLFNGLSGLNSLNLRNNPGLTSLDADLFDGLSGLSILNLSNNPGLRSLDADLFDGLSSLRAVNLSNIPGSTSLPLDLFEDTPNLGSLNLSNNPGLTSLDVNLIDGLSSLSSLNLDNTGLTSLPDNLFANAPDLGTLRLGRTPELMSLPPGFLDNVLFNLTSLLLDPRLRRALTLSVDFNGDLPQGRGVFLRFNLGTPMEAGLGVRVPYTTVFSDDGTAGHFIGLSADGTVDIRPGMTEATIEVTASSTATLDATAIITLGAPSVLYDRNGDGTSTDVKIINMNPNFVRQLDPVRNLVMVDTASNEQTLTIVEPPPDPSRITAISVTNNPVPEGDPVAVRITLDQPLPENGGVSYTIVSRGSRAPIDNRDIFTGNSFADTPRTQTINFRTNQLFADRVAIDDNRVEPDLEEGTIRIGGIFWGENFTGFAPTENNTVGFSIEDNDAINLTLGIEDNDDISVALINGVYQVRVRESTTALDVSIGAEPAPIPPDPDGVILDRSITAGLMSSDGTADGGGTDFTFPGLTATYSSIEEDRAQSTFASVIGTINIHDRNSGEEKEFTLALSSQDRAANINTPSSARVTIVPDTGAEYDSLDDLTLVENSAMSAVRTLTLLHAPSTDATVHFRLARGTLLTANINNLSPDIRLDIGGDGGVLAIDSDNMSGNFRIHAGGDGVATLFFRDNPDVTSAGTNIGFTITGIIFDDLATVTDIDQLPEFTINISSGGNPVAIVGDTIGTLSEAAPANTSTAGFTLSILNLPDDHGRGSLQLGIPQRDEDNPGRPRVGDDYRYQHQVGNLPAVSSLISSSSVVNIMIPSNQVSEDGAVDIVFTFTALDDNYDENEAIRIIFTRPVTFQNADPALNLTPSRSNFIIPIADDDQVEATLNKSDQIPFDVNELIPNRANIPSTFTVTIANAPDADARVTYTLTGGADEKYNAFLSTGPSLSSASRSFFIIREDDIIGSSPGSQGDGPGMAKATIVILPLDDADGDDEDVTLIIHSILFANGSNHANLDGGDIQGAVNGSLTLTITDDDPLPDANYTPGGDISITRGGEFARRTLTLVNAPSDIATVEFAFDGGTAGTGTESSITFSVSGVGNLAFNADGTTGTFTIPADTAATILTFAANTDSTGGQLTFTITGITFDDPDTITDIGPLAPLNIIITDPTPARLMVSVNPDLETGQTTDIVFALGNVPGRVGGVDVARTEFVFEGFPPADQFTPNSGNPAPLTFVSTNYNLTISNNILGWSITGVSTGRLTVNVSASALTGRAATVTLRVTAKDVAMLTATHVMTRVFDAGDRDLGHPFTNTGALGFTIRGALPTRVTDIVFDSNNVAENEDIAVTVTLDQPLPRDGTLRYTVLAGAADGISANDVTAGFGEVSVSADADSSTFRFTVDVFDDNRIDAAEQEEGAINIISVEWEDGGGFQVNDSRTFTITDNDGITLTLGIEDNDDIPVMLIAGEYRVRVRESIPTLDVSIRAEPAPDPLNFDGVILDRSITASLMSSDGTAADGEDFAFPGLMTTYSEGSAAQAAFASVTTAIAIHDRDSDQEKVFTLALSSQDRAANINTPPNRARVTIVPDTEADYRSTSDLTIIEGGDAASAERTLILRYAPTSTTATVNFAFSGGTVAGLGDTADIFLVVTGGESIDSASGSGNFQIPAGTDDVTDVMLVFRDNASLNSAGRNIVFTITGITFDDPGTVTDIGELPRFTIIISSSDEPAAIVSEPTGTLLSEAAPANTSSARFTLSIRNLPADHGGGSFQLTIPQRNEDHPERPQVGDDYRYQHQVGNLTAVSHLTLSFPVMDIEIPSNQVVDGTVDIVFTFTAVDDNYDEADEEIDIMFTQVVTFPNADSLPALTPSRNNFSISIDDDDQVEATLNEGDQSAVDVEGNGNNTDGTFVLTIANAPDADATVTYTLTGEEGKYTASLPDNPRLDGTPNSVFIIPEADITGDGPDDQGGSPGMARATITISPLHDADGDDEDVTLIIHSITFDNGSGHGDLDGGDIRGAAVNGSLTLTITDEDPRPEASYTPDGDISITEGRAPVERTLTLDNAPTGREATVEFTFGGGTVGTDADTESDINFRVSGGGDLTFNADGTTGTFTIPADTAATLTFTANADPDSTGERILFTITGITFDDPDTITDIGPLAPLAIIITDPTPASLMVSVGNSDLEIGATTTIVFALGNVPERVRGVAVARTEFVFEGFPAANQFNPNSSTDAQRERTFRSDGYDLTISANIRDWSITDAGHLTVSVPASALAGEAATVTLTVTANGVADLDATHVMTQVFDAGNNPLTHSFTNTGTLGFTIRRADPTGVTIMVDDVAENENTTVTVTLNQPLPRDGTLTYTVLAGSAPSISANDVTAGFNEASVSANAGSDTFEFTVGVADDNRIDAAEREEGAINIISVEWEDGGGFEINDSRTFTITDNDRITLTLDDGDYEVRDNAGTLTVTVNAAPNPTPSTTNVILERTVTANFFTRDGVGVGAATVSEGDYVAVASGSGSAPALAFTDNLNSVAYDIVIENDDDDINETFTVNLGSSDNAVNLGTPNTADVIIVPNTTGDYGSASTTIALNEASGTSATRTLRLSHAPNRAATVSFALTGGTVTRENFASPHALVLSVRDGATGLNFGDGNSTGSFTVQPGDNEVTLRFEAPADFYGDDETITFFITGITFDDDGDDTTDTPADALPPPLTISITDVGAAATVTADNDDTGISELAPELDTAVIRVRLTDIPSAATTAVISFTLAGAATRTTDYTVTLAGSSTSANSVTITKADIDGNDQGVPQGGAPGSAEATLTFRAINDLADIEEETIKLTIDSVMFAGAAPESDLAIADGIEDSSQTIIITDRPLTPLAIFSVGEASVNEGDDALSDMPNFRITLSNISSSTRTSTVHYEFSDGFGETASTDPPGCANTEGADYCAFRKIGTGSLTALTTQTGSFMFPVSSVSGGQPIDIFILPRNDDDAEDEIVELEITSITVPQSDGTIIFNLASGNLVNSSNRPMSTARITINDSARFGVTRIEIDNAANIPESGNITVAVILNRPLRENARLRYGIRAQANSANSIVADDMEDGFNDTFTPTVRVGLSTIRFTVRVTDDNRIEPTMEQGVIEILRLDLLDSDTQERITANNTATFTITDNDKISLSIAGATVSENIVSLGYTVAAVAAAVPRDDRVVLDRAVAATLISTGGSATTGGTNADYDGLPAAIVFPANDVARVALTSTPPVSIVINNDGEVVEENFILALTSNDPAVEIADGTASTITIAPDPRAVFNGTLTLTFTESDGPMTRTLNISNVPDNTTATVSFGVSGGTASPTDDPLHDFILTVADDVSTSILTFSGGNTNVEFTIPADRFVNGSTVITLTFTPIADEDSDSEEINFGVANLRFPSNPIYDAGAQSPNLLITINEGALQLRIRVFLEGALQ